MCKLYAFFARIENSPKYKLLFSYGLDIKFGRVYYYHIGIVCIVHENITGFKILNFA